MLNTTKSSTRAGNDLIKQIVKLKTHPVKKSANHIYFNSAEILISVSITEEKINRLFGRKKNNHTGNGLIVYISCTSLCSTF